MPTENYFGKAYNPNGKSYNEIHYGYPFPGSQAGVFAKLGQENNQVRTMSILCCRDTE